MEQVDGGLGGVGGVGGRWVGILSAQSDGTSESVHES